MLKVEGFKKYFKNTSWLFIERVVRLLVVLAVGIYVARYLGDELFGQLNYATGFVGLFFALTSMGLDEIIVRDLVREPHRRDELLGSAAVIKLCGAFMLMIMVLLAVFIKGGDQLTSTLIIIIAIAEPLNLFSMIDYYFLANVRTQQSMKVQMTQVFISAAAKLTLIWFKADLIWFAGVYALDSLVMSIGYLIAYKAEGMLLRSWKFTRESVGHLLGQSWPLIIYGMALFIQAKIDQVMIGDMLTKTLGKSAANAEVGQYSVALKMIEALGFLPVIVQKSLAPAITNAKMRDGALYADRLLNQYRLMFLLFLITSVPLYFLAEPIVVTLYGEQFQPAGWLLSLFAIRLLFTNMGVAKSSFITNESLFKYSLMTAIVGAVINIVMNYLLIPEFRSIGAIWATIGSFTISIFIMDLFFKETRDNFRWMMKAIFSFWKIKGVS